jgi:membrane protease YdiL (CAAX protease family)
VIELEWDPAFAPLALTLATATAACVASHYALTPARVEGWLSERGWDAERAQAAGVMGARLLRSLAFGAAAGVVFATGALPDLWAPPPAWAWGVALVGVLAIAPILWAAAGGVLHQARYPEVRAKRWSRGLAAAEAGSWAVYLLAYEAVFRGSLLFGLAAWGGAWPALLIATALYVLAHLPKDAGECVGCAVMGLAFGALAFRSGGVIAPWLLHLGIALSASAFAVARRSPMPSSPSSPSSARLESSSCAADRRRAARPLGTRPDGVRTRP